MNNVKGSSAGSKTSQFCCLFSIFTVPRSNITIGPQQDIWHPVRYSGHLLTKLFQGYFLFAFDDQFVVHMPADEAVGKGLHRIHQQVTADR